MARTREHYEATYRLLHAEADLAYSLDVFGDHLAENHDLGDLYGLDAVHLYLVKKHGWTPAQARDMSPEDKRLALTTEMEGYTLPKEAIFRQI